MNFSQFKTIEQFKAYIAPIDDPFDLTEVRDVVRTWNRGKTPHHLRKPDGGFAEVFTALDDQAETLGFLKYPFGYRKPSTPQS